MRDHDLNAAQYSAAGLAVSVLGEAVSPDAIYDAGRHASVKWESLSFREEGSQPHWQ